MSRLLRFGFWIAVILAVLVALTPQPPQLPGGPSDKVLHIIAFAILALLGSSAYREVALLRLGFTLSVLGALIEVTQAIPALHRDSSALDWLADTVAAAVVLAVVFAWRCRNR